MIPVGGVATGPVVDLQCPLRLLPLRHTLLLLLRHPHLRDPSYLAVAFAVVAVTAAAVAGPVETVVIVGTVVNVVFVVICCEGFVIGDLADECFRKAKKKM